MRRLMVVFFAMFAAGPFVLGAGPGQGPTIEYATGFSKLKVVAKTNSGKVSGKLDSTEADCIPGRKVKAFRKRNGKTKTLGSDETNGKGKFKVTISSVKNGKYFAKVSKKELSPADTGQARVCVKEKSGSVTVS